MHSLLNNTAFEYWACQNLWQKPTYTRQVWPQMRNKCSFPRLCVSDKYWPKNWVSLFIGKNYLGKELSPLCDAYWTTSIIQLYMRKNCQTQKKVMWWWRRNQAARTTIPMYWLLLEGEEEEDHTITRHTAISQPRLTISHKIVYYSTK